MHFLLIFLPLIALATGIAAYIQYLKSPGQRAMEGYREGGSDERHAENETVYQGLLWLKNKYEEDRELSTEKYMELKGEYERLREKYQALETGHAYTQELLNERQSTIDRLRDQLQQETLKTAEAKGKLESSGHLLLQMHKELDLVMAGDQPRAAGSQETLVESQEASMDDQDTLDTQEPSIESGESSPGSKEPSIVVAQ